MHLAYYMVPILELRFMFAHQVNFIELILLTRTLLEANTM